MIENGQRVTPAVALTGFRKPVLRELCKVGIVYLGVSLILALITRFAVQPDFWEQVRAQQRRCHPGRAGRPGRAGMFLIFALYVVAADLAVLCRAADVLAKNAAGQGRVLQLLRRLAHAPAFSS